MKDIPTLPRSVVTKALKNAGVKAITAQHGEYVMVTVAEQDRQQAARVFHVHGFRVPFITNTTFERNIGVIFTVGMQWAVEQ